MFKPRPTNDDGISNQCDIPENKTVSRNNEGAFVRLPGRCSSPNPNRLHPVAPCGEAWHAVLLHIDESSPRANLEQNPAQILTTATQIGSSLAF